MNTKLISDVVLLQRHVKDRCAEDLKYWPQVCSYYEVLLKHQCVSSVSQS